MIDWIIRVSRVMMVLWLNRGSAQEHARVLLSDIEVELSAQV
jgi:hypothetical protein